MGLEQSFFSPRRDKAAHRGPQATKLRGSVKKSKARPEESPLSLARQEPAAKSEPSSSLAPLAETWPIVGIGASAGGLEAFAQLLGELPSDTGMAFVLIQHLDPTHPSLLAEVLTKATKMPVCQAEDGKRIEPDHVYVIPPNADIAILHGRRGSTACRAARSRPASWTVRCPFPRSPGSSSA